MNGLDKVTFKSTFHIEVVYVDFQGPDSHYGTKGLRKVALDCPSIGKVTFQFSYAAGNNNGTSVEDGQIPEIIFYT
jgi:BTB/POZ domain-containing protein 1/2